MNFLSFSLITNGTTGLTAAAIALVGNTISVNFQSVALAENSIATIVVNARALPEPFPEPGSIALFGVGLAGLFALRRRSARTRA